ncbi:MAG: Ribosomal RNA small subunit methyltransferase H [Candidatus Magasanikbacteria bacterium GW2011_GWA2_56_11]|uniref:Ribosomal RNA small subunit methyltransferase H n=1 Tax=Candidatus Magasanikbacteria bacterium GW2011_GWA2_56_11 TaxID=1619044 RepID=A0A0G2B7D3_9BACT|nr:MAG: Ribosomal RNA small subunit methyltransferase H [Candidatus Magasanikbacteria bacterium GW2011_GWA2_56_11]
MRHLPVLATETIASLLLAPGKNVVDCTLGDAGHAEMILEATAPNGRLLGIDADPESILRAKQYLYRFGERAMFVRDNFEHLAGIVKSNNFGPVHGIVIDLGWSSPQFEERGRGFSFQQDEPLDMRYGSGDGAVVYDLANPTAADLVNSLAKEELERIFRDYGEENLAREIAAAITLARRSRPVTRTGQLVEIVLGVYRQKLKTDKPVPWVGGLHPATKVFQALRLAVNRELEVIEAVLPQAVEALEPGGRLAVIAFHSLEDRIIKHFFKSLHGKTLTIITKKPLECGPAEYEANPRSRSAKLRVVEKR